MTMKKRNVYALINGAAVSCAITVNRWIVGEIKAVCNRCGVKFKIDDSSIDERDDTVVGIFAAESVDDYLAAAQDLHRECGFDLA